MGNKVTRPVQNRNVRNRFHIMDMDTIADHIIKRAEENTNTNTNTNTGPNTYTITITSTSNLKIWSKSTFISKSASTMICESTNPGQNTITITSPGTYTITSPVLMKVNSVSTKDAPLLETYSADDN